MAEATFAGVDLATHGMRSEMRSPEVRSYREFLPGVDGAFVQSHGRGARTMAITGWLRGTGLSAPAALAQVMEKYEQAAALADGRTVGIVESTDGRELENCMLQSYHHGLARTERVGANNYAVWLPVEAEVLKLTP